MTSSGCDASAIRIAELEALLAKATGFLFEVPQGSRMRHVEIRIRIRPGNPESWAVVGEGSSVLSRDGDWEYESLPSNRTDEFLQRCRYGSYAEAFSVATEFFKACPQGYPDYPDASDGAAANAAVSENIRKASGL
jgi:hypothetical protein